MQKILILSVDPRPKDQQYASRGGIKFRANFSILITLREEHRSGVQKVVLYGLLNLTF